MNKQFFQLRRAYIKELMSSNSALDSYYYAFANRYGRRWNTYSHSLESFNHDITWRGYFGRLKMSNPSRRLEDMIMDQKMDVIFGETVYGRLIRSFSSTSKT